MNIDYEYHELEMSILQDTGTIVIYSNPYDYTNIPINEDRGVNHRQKGPYPRNLTSRFAF